MDNETKIVDSKTPDTPTSGEATGSGERMFTQDEVNQIVKERLRREKGKPDPEFAQRESALSEREAKIVQRERALECREYLAQSGYPAELLDVLDTSDLDNFKQKADRAAQMLEVTRKRNAPLAPLPNRDALGDGNGYGSGFQDSSHTPRPYY